MSYHQSSPSTRRPLPTPLPRTYPYPYTQPHPHPQPHPQQFRQPTRIPHFSTIPQHPSPAPVHTPPRTASSGFVPLWKPSIIAPPAIYNNYPTQSVHLPAAVPYHPNTASRPTSPSKRPLPVSPIQHHNHNHIIVQPARPIPSAYVNPRINGRPLPPAPANPATHVHPHSQVSPSRSDSDSPEESESDLEYSPSDPPSPQYGIRDLPNRVTNPPDGGSMSLRFTSMGLQPSQHPRHPHSHPTSQRQQPQVRSPLPPKPESSWPVDIAPLPRAPGIHSALPPPNQTQHRHQHQQTQVPRSPVTPARSINVNYAPDLDDAPPPPSLRRTPVTANTNTGVDDTDRPYRRQPPPRWIPPNSNTDTDPDTETQPSHVHVKIESPAPMGGRATRADIPRIEFPAGDDNGSGSGSEEEGEGDGPTGVPVIHVQGPPTISISGPGPQISISGPDDSDGKHHAHAHAHAHGHADASKTELPPLPIPMPRRAGAGLVCGQCGGAIIGRIVNAMGVRWHPGCFRCTVCDGLLEHVSSYEKEGRPYCHLDYHEKFAPRCYTCKTAIIDERFITLDDPALGKRTYHEQHFFCAECGDPFLAPSSSSDARTRTGELNVTGDGAFEDDDVGFTVYQGHPYCEACHVRLRMPKCRKCKKSIRDGMQAVEALGGKWCWGCFVCAGCERPFEEPSFFQREGLPFCQRCFSIILKNEL